MPFFYRGVMLTSDGKSHYLLHFTPRWSCELSNLQTWQLCSFFLAVERVQKNVCRHDLPKFQLLETQCNECYSCSGAPNDRFLGNICSEPSRLAKIFESPRTAKIFENVSWGLFVGLRVSGFVWFVHLRISDFVVISKFWFRHLEIS